MRFTAILCVVLSLLSTVLAQPEADGKGSDVYNTKHKSVSAASQATVRLRCSPGLRQRSQPLKRGEDHGHDDHGGNGGAKKGDHGKGQGQGKDHDHGHGNGGGKKGNGKGGDDGGKGHNGDHGHDGGNGKGNKGGYGW
ncbi:hypothetical protein C8F01DRAFT_1228737 [Mycena amicta]|nr:hypothetical protein C8F01DRAFT_1228737 [Mycena amicta]